MLTLALLATLATPAPTHLLRVHGAPVAPARFALRSPLLEAPAHSDRDAPAPPGAPETAATLPVESTVMAPESLTPDEVREETLLRQRRRVQRAHYPFGIATWASLVATDALGTLLAINQRTPFGEGLCASGASHAIFGDFGCNGGLGAWHEVSGFVTVALYATTGIYALEMLGLDHAGASPTRRSHLARDMHVGTVYLHLAGMVLAPILGILSANPGLVGLRSDPSDPGSFQRIQDYQSAMRAVHLGVGFLTLGALTTAMILEFNPP